MGIRPLLITGHLEETLNGQHDAHPHSMALGWPHAEPFPLVWHQGCLLADFTPSLMPHLGAHPYATP
jgi:hypothetical protein